MFRITSRARQSVIVGAIAGLSLTLGACSGGGSSDSSSSGSSPSDPTSTSTQASSAPPVAASGEFCSQSIDSIAASNDMTDATGRLNATLSDPTIFASGDMTAIHELSQAMMDSATVSAAFYAAGAEHATDANAQAAFDGLSDFVNQYSIPVAQAGLDATSMTEYSTSVTTMLGDPDVQALLPQAADWASTVADYTAQECDIDVSGTS